MSFDTAIWIIAFVGGVVGVFFCYIILETLIFKRITDDPVVGKLSAVVASWIAVSMLYGFNLGNNGFDGRGFIYYLPGAMLIGIYAYRRGLRVRKRDQDAIDATFE